jgi:hypothetical protein
VIHGIKGSSHGIFASEAGNAAEALETASKAGDRESVNAGHAAFAEIVSELISSIKGALETIDLNADKPVLAEPDKELLAELREAAEAFDMDRADEIVTRLESFRYERGGKTVEWLREQIGKTAFEEIYGGEWPSG